jgi:GNAT superfamily N-acetyltransferase
VTVLDLESIPERLRSTQDPLHARIEDAALTASQPREQAIYDGWLLRYANGKAKRARSINLIAAGERPLEEKLAHCREFYRRHGVPMVLRMTPFSRPLNVDAALARLGYIASEDTRVMVASSVPGREVPAAAPAPAASAQKLLLEAVDRAVFAAAFVELHQLDAARAAVEQQRHALSVVDGIYLVMRDRDGQAVACGSAVMDGDLIGIFGMVTAPSRRGQGLATRIVGELLQRAHERGCSTAYLQVEAGNAPARRAYSKFGFRDGYAYWYRRPPGEGTT